MGAQSIGFSSVKVAARQKALPRPPPTVRVWQYKSSDPTSPAWPEDQYDVAKSDVLQVMSLSDD